MKTNIESKRMTYDQQKQGMNGLYKFQNELEDHYELLLEVGNESVQNNILNCLCAVNTCITELNNNRIV